MNGGDGRCVPGRSSTAVTRHGSDSRQRLGKPAGRGLAEPADLVGLQAAGGIEVAAAGHARVTDALEPGGEADARAAQTRLQVPVGAAAEGAALLLALDDEAHGHALHPSGAEPGLDLLPEHRREHVAVQPIDDAAALLGVDELEVDVARVLDGRADGLLGDLVEDDAPDRHLWLEHLAQVPADRLALAVGVGGQQHLGRVLHRRAQLADPAGLVARDDVVRAEAVVDVDRHRAPRLVLDLGRDLAGVLGEVADVADAGLDAVLVAQQSRERPGLGRRFDNDERLRHHSASMVRVIRSGSVAPAPGRTAVRRSRRGGR